MQDAILSTLLGETVIHANPVATVTRNCLIIRDEGRHANTVLSIQSIREIRKIDTTNAPFLAISAGLFTIAAACYASHQGLEISLLIALLGLVFTLAYFSTRRATIWCRLDDQTIESRRGTFREATSILRAVRRVSSGSH